MPLGLTVPSSYGSYGSPYIGSPYGMSPYNSMTSRNIGGPSSSLQNQYSLYGTGVGRNLQDYGDIMGGYKSMFASATRPSYTPTTSSYTSTPDVQSSISNLGGLAKTGGYSDEDVANLRARAIAPIRSIYGQAQTDIDRQRMLQGGYSPNYTAASTQLARDMSDRVSGAETNVNAQVAQAIAQNRLEAAGPYNAASAQQSDLMNRIAQANAGIQNQAGQFNAQRMPQIQGEALAGMRSLYGTTPELSATFGSQAMQGANLQNNIFQRNQDRNLQYGRLF